MSASTLAVSQDRQTIQLGQLARGSTNALVHAIDPIDLGGLRHEISASAGMLHNYRSALLADPRGFVHQIIQRNSNGELGLPAHLRVVVLEDSDTVRHLVVPSVEKSVAGSFEARLADYFATRQDEVLSLQANPIPTIEAALKVTEGRTVAINPAVQLNVVLEQADEFYVVVPRPESLAPVPVPNSELDESARVLHASTVQTSMCQTSACQTSACQTSGCQGWSSKC